MAEISLPGEVSELPPPDAPTISRVRARPWRTLTAGKLLRRLWYDRSVRWQLLATFVLINLVAGVAAAVIVIYNAQRATKVEIAASMEVAEHLVRGTVEQLGRETSGIHPLENLPLQSLEKLPLRVRNLRHVRILITDANGRQISQLPAEAHNDPLDQHAEVPRWFTALFRVGNPSREVPVTLSGRHIGTVFIVGQASDEIAEVWQDLSDVAVVVLIANMIVIGLFYLALGRVLNPLTSLAIGLRELEQGRFRHRLAPPKARELADIVARFNTLAGGLEAARTDNARLNRRLVTVQDDERRQIATELHDEMGACLFGLRANLVSVRRLAGSLPPGTADPMRERVATLVEVSERIQSTNRRVLRRIRPMSIGHAPLADVIADLVADFERNDPDHIFILDVGRLSHGYSDCIDLTVYRCVQEGLTNAVQHAEAKTIVIRLEQRTTPLPRSDGWSASAVLRLAVKDDGRGLRPGMQRGLGLTGMEERVRALGGTFAISNRPDGGTCLDIAIPIEEAEWSASDSVGMREGRQ